MEEIEPKETSSSDGTNTENVNIDVRKQNSKSIKKQQKLNPCTKPIKRESRRQSFKENLEETRHIQNTPSLNANGENVGSPVSESHKYDSTFQEDPDLLPRAKYTNIRDNTVRSNKSVKFLGGKKRKLEEKQISDEHERTDLKSDEHERTDLKSDEEGEMDDESSMIFHQDIREDKNKKTRNKKIKAVQNKQVTPDKTKSISDIEDDSTMATETNVTLITGNTSYTNDRRPNNPWTAIEIENLMEGHREVGNNWAEILRMYDFGDRLGVDLKDKFRGITKTTSYYSVVRRRWVLLNSNNEIVRDGSGHVRIFAEKYPYDGALRMARELNMDDGVVFSVGDYTDINRVYSYRVIRREFGITIAAESMITLNK